MVWSTFALLNGFCFGNYTGRSYLKIVLNIAISAGHRRNLLFISVFHTRVKNNKKPYD